MKVRRPYTPPSEKAAVRLIIDEAAAIFHVSPEKIKGRSRLRPIVRARQAVCRVAYDQGWTSSEIARRLAGRDHTTILHARDQVAIHHPRDRDFAERFDLLAGRAASLKGQGYA